MKLVNVDQLCSMDLWNKFGSSTLSHPEEIGIESCQNVSALPADKPNKTSSNNNMTLNGQERDMKRRNTSQVSVRKTKNQKADQKIVI